MRDPSLDFAKRDAKINKYSEDPTQCKLKLPLEKGLQDLILKMHHSPLLNWKFRSLLSMISMVFVSTFAAQAQLKIPKANILLVDDTAQVSALQDVTIDVLDNDRGKPKNAIPRLAEPPQCGTVEARNTKLLYRATDQCSGIVTFRYGIAVHLTAETALVEITVLPIEPAPQPQSEPDPPEPITVARDDFAETQLDQPVAVEILKNDTIGGPLMPQLSLEQMPNCGTARFQGWRMIFTPDATCTDSAILRYQLGDGPSAEVKISLKPVPNFCPDLPGISLVHIPETELDVGSVAQTSIGKTLVDGLKRYGALPQIEVVKSFCISPVHASQESFPEMVSQDSGCRFFDVKDVAVEVSLQEAKSATDGYSKPGKWSADIPNASEFLVAIQHLQSSAKGADKTSWQQFENSLRRGAREWLNAPCNESSSFVIGGNCDRDVSVNCYRDEFKRGDFGFRFVVRPESR